MHHTIKKITIVGGGSSGWMTAAGIAKLLPNVELTVRLGLTVMHLIAIVIIVIPLGWALEIRDQDLKHAVDRYSTHLENKSQPISTEQVYPTAVLSTEDVARAVERSALSKAGRGAAAEAIPEAVQAGQERFSQNLAEQREGYDTDLMKGVVGQAAFEGLAGGILGGALGPLEGHRAAPEGGEAQAELAPVPEPTAPAGGRYAEATAPRVDLRDRLTAAAGEDLSRGAYAAVNALNLRLSNDIDVGTPESIDTARKIGRAHV